MNKNKIHNAKATAGITYPVKTVADFKRAQKHCKSLIVQARRDGDDSRAAELSEAKSNFKIGSQKFSHCLVCGNRITRGATHCRIHKPKNTVKLLNPIVPVQQKTKVGKHQQRRWKPSDRLANLGFYATPIQKVLKGWRKKVGREFLDAHIEDLLYACLPTEQRSIDRMILEFHLEENLRFLFDLILAMDEIHNPESIEGFILTAGYSGDDGDYADGVPTIRTWEKLSALSGGKYSAAQLSKASSRLRLGA